MQFTGEQFIPGLNKKRLVDEHLQRYEFASKYAKNKNVLDAACGTGYGTYELSKLASNAIGLDISEESIAYANNNFIGPNLKYKLTSIENANFEPNYFDLICSFETIEHLEPEGRKTMVNNFYKWLKPTGTLILSTPNKIITSPFSEKPLNKYHVTEFTRSDLLNELSIFKIQETLGQRLVKKTLTKPIIRRLLSFASRFHKKLTDIYTLADGAKIQKYNPRDYEPRIHVIVCEK